MTRRDRNAAPFVVEHADGVAYGPWRAPSNIGIDAEGTIHDDATAQALGLRGGTVAGSIHMEQFAPLAAAVFGERWLGSGGLGLYFLAPTRDGEAVRAALRPAGSHAQAHLIDDRGVVIAEGDCWPGRSTDTALRRRCAAAQPAKDLRILSGLRVGARAEAVGSISADRLARDLRTITEPMPIYEPPVFGLPCNLAIDLLRAAETALAPLPEGVVGLYGGIELEMFAGPLRAETDYTVRAEILALTESPKTEGIWHQAYAANAAGEPVARLLLFSRVMKASSPLWT